MDGISIVSIVTVTISLGTLLVSIFSYRQKAETNYVNSLEERIKTLETKMKECEQARVDLLRKNQEVAEENLRLLKQLIKQT